jgi:PAS domain S-box-containing protein
MPSAPTDPLSVLVVDDDSALIRTLADILRLHGYAPSTAATGREGLAIAAEAPPALAVIDLRLPDMDGLELIHRLHEVSEQLQVVILTGNATVESAVAALREHSIDYLIKPVDVERLLQVASLATERWQRRQAEERLRESDERFRRVVQSDLLGIFFWNERGIFDANDAFLEMLGYTQIDLGTGMRASKLTPEEYHELDALKWREINERGIVAPYEKEFIARDGRRVPVLFGAATLEKSKKSGVAFVLDIADRKAAERSLVIRARQQQAVVRLGQFALGREDIAALFDEATRLVADTLDVPLTGILERRSDGVSLVLRAGVGWGEHQIGQLDVDALREQGVIGGVTVAIPGSVNAYGVLAAHDRVARAFTPDDVLFLQAIAHVLGTAVDRARTEAALRQTQRLEAVGRLASGVSHDFNNMLTAITGFADMIRLGLPANDPLREDAQEILSAAHRAAGLTRQLLAFSRQQVMEPRQVGLNELVRSLEKMLGPLLGPEIKLVRDLASDIGLVRADPGKIEQVILNLCVNARDAMPDGGTLTIQTANAELDASYSQRMLATAVPGPYVMLAVTDTGTGMDAETQARVFEPFFTTKAPDKGTGLGLATVYGIVKQSDGEIWLYSEPGIGTTFKIFLPRVDEDVEAARRSTPVRVTAHGSETILIADDEEQNRTVTRRILERAGYVVLVARDGADAIEVAKTHAGPIDLVATDLMMPRLGGPELAAALRESRPGIRVLFLSGYSDGVATGEGLIGGKERLLEKPFTGESLLRTVREVLDAKQ